MTQTSDPNAARCRELVRDSDHDRYLSALLADKEKHRALFAIYAFDADVSAIAGRVSEPGIGEIRLQWWRDELDAVFDSDCSDHPIALELQRTLQDHDLPKHLLAKLIDAHQFDIYREPMATLTQLLDYQSATATAITELAARVLIGDEAIYHQYLTDKAGIAWGLANTIKTLPRQVALKQCFLPVDLLEQQDASFHDVQMGQETAGVKLVTVQLCHLIAQKLGQLRHEQSMAPRKLLPAYYPASISGYFAKHTARNCEKPLTQPYSISQLKMQLMLFKKSLFEQI